MPVPAWHWHCLPVSVSLPVSGLANGKQWQWEGPGYWGRTLRAFLLFTRNWGSAECQRRVTNSPDPELLSPVLSVSVLPPPSMANSNLYWIIKEKQWSSNGNLTSLLSIWKYFLKLIENCSNVKFHLLRTFFRKDFQHFAFNDHFTEQELLKIQIRF